MQPGIEGLNDRPLSPLSENSSLQVDVYNTQKRFPINPLAIQTIVKEVLKAEGLLCNEVAIHFVGTKKICTLHETYFNDPSVTDCISFPIDNRNETTYIVLGEVFVCPTTAFQYVKTHGGVLEEEIILYCVHGLLHLFGYDDQCEADIKVMRERERFHMDHLKACDLLRAFC